MTALISKPGISSATTLAIPKDWDKTWFRNLIQNQLKGADVRNAIGAGGIVISGNISSPYATIGFGAPVTLPGPVTISGGNPSLTINGVAGGVTIKDTTASTVAQFSQLATIGSSGGDYPYFGYNFLATTSAGVYDYAVSDFASAIQFPSGGIQLKTAPSGTAGNPITWTTRLSITQPGAVSIAAPSSAAVALTVNAISGSRGIQVVGAGAGIGVAITTGTTLGLYIDNTAQGAGTPAIRVDSSATTGAATPTLGTVKPGANTAASQWLPISINGTTMYIPLWL